MLRCAWMCTCARVCVGMHDCAWMCADVHRCLRVYVWGEFSEYLLETRVLTSADFTSYPSELSLLTFVM